MNIHALPVTLSLLLAVTFASARDCPANTSIRIQSIDFTAHPRSIEPRDRLLFLPAGMREAHVHVVATGHGTITYRWYRDEQPAADAQATIGAPDRTEREWDSWSNLVLPAPPRSGLHVQLLGPASCVLAEAALAGSSFATQPQVQAALTALAGDDAIDAKIALGDLPQTATDPALRLFAQQLLERDAALARAARQVRDDQLFLVEATLHELERRLTASMADRALRTRIANVRRAADLARMRLRHDDALTVLAVRHLLATQKLIAGDYPLLREEADRLVTPALARAGDQFRMTDWHPTLRGYRLLLQDKRTGESFEVTPD